MDEDGPISRVKLRFHEAFNRLETLSRTIARFPAEDRPVGPGA